jgi:hypothetical protein
MVLLSFNHIALSSLAARELSICNNHWKHRSGKTNNPAPLAVNVQRLVIAVNSITLGLFLNLRQLGQLFRLKEYELFPTKMIYLW